jgi:competence protein ComEC
MKRPILYIVIPFCFGIALAKFFNPSLVYPVILSSALLVLAILMSGRNILSHIWLYLAILFFGMAVYQDSIQLPFNHISRYVQDAPRKVLIRGVVTDDPTTNPALYGKKKTTFTLRAEAIKDVSEKKGTEGQIREKEGSIRAVEGLVKAGVYSDKEILVAFGDELILEGALTKPRGLKNPGVFDYEEYLSIKGVYALLKVKEDFLLKKLRSGGGIQKAAYKLRGVIRGSFDRYLGSPYSGFTKALLIGDRNDLDTRLNDEFIKTGTVHILAVSGFNVALMAAIALMIFGLLKIPKKISLSLTLAFIVFYSLMVGSNPPIVRATIMFAILAIGYMIDRDADMINSLSLAAFIILAVNPKELFDPSFQLSFVSVAGMILLTPIIDGVFPPADAGAGYMRKIIVYLQKGVSVSIAAWLGTWPLVLVYFNIVSPISVAANLVIVPTVSALTALGLILIPAGLSSGFLGPMVAAALLCLEKVMFAINGYFSRIPFAYFREAAPAPFFVALYYAFLGVLLMPAVFEFRRFRIKKSYLVIAALVLLNISAWSANIFSRNDDLRMTFLDVGQGDSTVIELPGKGNILIDGGRGGEGGYDAGRNIVAPYLWNRGIKRIDAVMVSHFHADHLGGIIYILENFKIGCVIDNGYAPAGNSAYGRYISVIKRKKIKRITVGAGDSIGPIRGVDFFILNPPPKEDPASEILPENDRSVVPRAVYKNFSAIFCGDITSKAISNILADQKDLKSDLIKFPHHGLGLGDSDIVAKFLAEAEPRICVTSSGDEYKKEGGGGAEKNYIKPLNVVFYETNLDGAITVKVNKKSVCSVSSFGYKN